MKPVWQMDPSTETSAYNLDWIVTGEEHQVCTDRPLRNTELCCEIYGCFMPPLTQQMQDLASPL